MQGHVIIFRLGDISRAYAEQYPGHRIDDDFPGITSRVVKLEGVDYVIDYDDPDNDGWSMQCGGYGPAYKDAEARARMKRMYFGKYEVARVGVW